MSSRHRFFSKLGFQIRNNLAAPWIAWAYRARTLSKSVLTVIDNKLIRCLLQDF